MKKKNNAFTMALEWLFLNGKAIDQKDVALKTGISVTTISRVKNHGVGRPDNKTIRKFNAAFDNVFNPDFLRGQSDVMFSSDLQIGDNPITADLHQLAPQATHIDQGSLMNATIAAQETAIESLKRELADKEESARREISKAEESAKRELATKQETIDALRGQLAEKEARLADKQAMIVNLQEQVTELKHRLAVYQSRELLGDYPFKMGAADDGDRPSAGK